MTFQSVNTSTRNPSGNNKGSKKGSRWSFRRRRKNRSSKSSPPKRIEADIVRDVSSLKLKPSKSFDTEEDSVEKAQSETSIPTIPPSPYETKDGNYVITAADAGLYPPSSVRESRVGVKKTKIDYDDPDFIAKSFSVDSSVRSPQRKGTKYLRSTVVLKEAPPAKQAAFSGPPRYDWIDIETAAAVKVQAAFRRNKVIWELEEKGMLTSAMRNRRRKQKYQSRKQKKIVSEDVPNIFGCCAFAFLFGDATPRETEKSRAERKALHLQKQKEQLEYEARQRKYYSVRRKRSENVLESIEVVEDVSFPSDLNAGL